jgi:transposase
MKYTTFVGMDVHAKTISVAIFKEDMKEPLYLGKFSNEPETIKKIVKKLGDPKDLYFCYEAGPCGYAIYHQLHKMGVTCLVAAPSLIPTKPGDRVKTDQRDAVKLARLLRYGELTSTYVPDERVEAVRELVRAREDAHEDLGRKRHQLTKFLLRNDIRPTTPMTRWTYNYRRWLDSLHLPELMQIVLVEYIRAMDEANERVKRFEQEIKLAAEKYLDKDYLQAFQALRGVGLITAVTLLCELGDPSRFLKATQLMSYSGTVPSEHSSGSTRHQGGITKTGNAHLRRVIVESAHHYRHSPKVGPTIAKRQREVSPEVQAIAWKAQDRLHRKYRKMLARGKTKQCTVVALSRELLGFVWAIAQQVSVEKQKVS